jgi:hypothetical protein
LRWEEKLFWLARGYRIIHFVEIICIEHGTFRSAIESELESYPCAVCQWACRAVILGEGVTSHELPPWELVEKPFAGKIRELLMMESVFDESYRQPKRQIADRHRRKALAVAAAAMAD